MTICINKIVNVDRNIFLGICSSVMILIVGAEFGQIIEIRDEVISDSSKLLLHCKPINHCNDNIPFQIQIIFRE